MPKRTETETETEPQKLNDPVEDLTEDELKEFKVKIENFERSNKQLEAKWLMLKEDAKTAKEVFENAVRDLRKFASGYADMPLFDSDKPDVEDGEELDAG